MNDLGGKIQQVAKEWAMHAVSVSGLKHNPADALRQARSSPVVVLNRDHPDAVLIGLEQGGVLQAPGVQSSSPTPAH